MAHIKNNGFFTNSELEEQLRKLEAELGGEKNKQVSNDKSLNNKQYNEVEKSKSRKRLTVNKLLKLAKQGDVNAQYRLANAYYRKNVHEKDYKDNLKYYKDEAIKWYRKAAEQGHAKALKKLELVLNGEGNKQVSNDKNSGNSQYDNIEISELKELFEQARFGDLNAQFYLGKAYAKGKDVPQDYKEAVKWYRKAAEQGNASAQNNLGFAYAKGKGVPQDYKEAVKWYRKAAEQGEASAQYNLGLAYAKGDGIQQDYKGAVKWYRKAAEQGHSDAQWNLGYAYYHGKGLHKDCDEALKWHKKSAEQGNVCGQYYLSGVYRSYGTKEDNKTAVKWLMMAAEKGFAPAQYALAESYAEGVGVKQNYTEAIKWFKKAAEQGYDDAESRLKHLRKLSK